MEVAIEYIRWLQEERAKINQADLSDIVFFENGMKLDLPPELIDEFGFTGMNNIDFISSDFYKKEWINNEQA